MSTGPYQTERDAQQAATAWPTGGEANASPNLTMILDACLGAGVVLGGYDAQIVAWLARGSPLPAR